MRVLITGVAGFIGCRLAATFLGNGHSIIGIDNLCRGSMENLRAISTNPDFSFERVELADLASFRNALAKVTGRGPIAEVWHMAANSDIPAGVNNPDIDFRDTFMTTYNTLLLMKEFDLGKIIFASSSAIYGDLGERELVEDIGPLMPISNYGAMKLAAEAIISASLEAHLHQAFIFRFPNVVGVPATHGVIQDFMRKLKKTPGVLDVLGDGSQQKSYLHVEELIDAMLFILAHARDKMNYYNIGAADDGVTVNFIAETVRNRVAPAASIRFGTGNKGWVGDVPKFRFSIEKLSALGWRPRLSSVESICKAVEEIALQEFGF